jgi:RNA polymerase sigma-70 factor (ECF subfamily)
LDERSRVRRFEQMLAAHLDAAYEFARWLTRDEHDAEDIVQEASLRAFRFLDGFSGDNGRAWLLAIVRNTYYTWLQKNRISASSVTLDEESLGAGDDELLAAFSETPVERLLEQKDAQRLINAALARLPDEFREVVVLRELEELSYKEIAVVAGIPIGTVMSRLARGRKLLLQHLQQMQKES